MLKNPHTLREELHVVPGAVVYLTLTLMYRGIVTHDSVLVNCTLSSLARIPNQSFKLSLKGPEGSG